LTPIRVAALLILITGLVIAFALPNYRDTQRAAPRVYRPLPIFTLLILERIG